MAAQETLPHPEPSGAARKWAALAAVIIALAVVGLLIL